MNISTRQIRFSTAKAFTLIELLTVVAIIAILMGLLLPVISSVKDAARRTQAKNDLNQIVTGVRNFYTEYGIYPLPSNLQGSLQTFVPGSGVTSTGTPSQDELMNVLRANDVGWDNTGSTNLNPRRIVYLEVPYVKDPTSPRAGIQNTNPPAGFSGDFYDPWGTPYIVFIDGGYTGSITPTVAAYKYSDANMYPLNLGVAGLSYGKDMGLGKSGNKTYAGSDDVISWQ